MITKSMAKGVKDTMAIIIAEETGEKQENIRKWLDTVKTPEDFFGKNNVKGLKEYEMFIRSRENEYNMAVRNKIKKL